MDALLAHFNISKNQLILDLACGKGRHAIYLNQLGYHVHGADLAKESIKEASLHRNEKLIFYVHDMREKLPYSYHFVLNLFTSFGYFENQHDNLKVLKSIKNSLLPGGMCIIDFLNLREVSKNLVKSSHKHIDGIDFHIEKELTDTHIIKHIQFEDSGQHHHFTERVQALYPKDFYALAKEAGMNVVATFGNYQLQPFDPEKSDRFIIALNHE